MKPRNPVVTAIAACVATLAAGTATAQAPRGAVLEEVLVTAQRRVQTVQDVALTVTAMSSADLQRGGVTDFRDLQTLVPGLTFGGQGSNAQPAIRGVSTLLSVAGAENPNAVYVDGVYHAAQNLLNMDLPDVERIEVLKGPQGTLFGRNATGGAIQIFTRNPSFEPTGDIAVETGYYTGSGSSRSSPRYQVKGFVSGPLAEDTLAASLSGSYQWVDGFMTNDATGERTGRIEKSSLRGKLLFTPNDSTEITLTGYYVDMPDIQGQLLGVPYRGFSAANAPEFQGPPLGGDGVVPSKPHHTAHGPGVDVAEFREYGGVLRAQFEFDAGTLTAITGYNDSFTNNHNNVDGAKSPQFCLATFACVEYDFTPETKELSQELNFASADIGNWSYVAGLFYYDAEGGTRGIIQQSLVPGGVLAQDNSYETRALAAYGEVTFTPTERLTLVAGLRWNRDEADDEAAQTLAAPAVSKSLSNTSTTPRVSATYAFSDSLNGYATYTRGFKSGLTGASNVANNYAPVDPEEIDAFEVGAKYATPGLAWNLAAFYYDYQNKQEQTFTGTSNIVKNTGAVEIYGVDADLSAPLSDSLSLRAALSWLPQAEYEDFPDASGNSPQYIPFPPNPMACIGLGCGGLMPVVFDASGDRLIRAPKLTSSLTLAYEAPLGEGILDASATLFYSSEVLLDITGFIQQDAYTSLTAQAGYSFGGGLRLGAYGRNLTDEEYFAAGLVSGSGFVVNYAPPRELGLTLSYAY